MIWFIACVMQVLVCVSACGTDREKTKAGQIIARVLVWVFTACAFYLVRIA